MPPSLSDTHPQVAQMQIQLLRRAGVDRRLELTFSLSQAALNLSRRALEQRYPGLSERERKLCFVAFCYGDEIARRLRDDMQQRGW